jgi:hypothetical protein
MVDCKPKGESEVGIRPIFLSNLSVDLFQEVFSKICLEILLVHKFGGDFLILLHAVNEQSCQRLADYLRLFLKPASLFQVAGLVFA